MDGGVNDVHVLGLVFARLGVVGNHLLCDAAGPGHRLRVLQRGGAGDWDGGQLAGPASQTQETLHCLSLLLPLLSRSSSRHKCKIITNQRYYQ